MKIHNKAIITLSILAISVVGTLLVLNGHNKQNSEKLLPESSSVQEDLVEQPPIESIQASEAIETARPESKSAQPQSAPQTAPTSASSPETIEQILSRRLPNEGHRRCAQSFMDRFPERFNSLEGVNRLLDFVEYRKFTSTCSAWNLGHHGHTAVKLYDEYLASL